MESGFEKNWFVHEIQEEEKRDEKKPDSSLYRVAQQKRNGIYFPQNMDAITNISLYEVISPEEKWYQDQQFWVSLFSRAHFVRQCRGQKFSLFSLN